MKSQATTMINPSGSTAGKLKSSLPWKIFVLTCVPFFDFLWQNIFHPKARLAYLFSRYSRVTPDHELNANALKIYPDTAEFKEVAKFLKSKISTELLEQRKNALLSNKDEVAFVDGLEAYVDDDTKLALLKFATSEPVLEKIIPFFGMIPRIDTLAIMYNIPRPDFARPEGSQRWHRDGDFYKMLSLYVTVTDLDENSGMYSAVGENTFSFHEAIPIEFFDPSISLWKNGRYSDEYLRKFVKESEIVNFTGPSGTGAIADSASCYHKGGYCKERPRVMLQVNYVMDQSHTRESVLKNLKLENHPQLEKILNSQAKRMMIDKNSPRLGKFVFTLARRLLTYYVKPL